mgnify:FL=1|jgi:hypothetical protein|tara:strand:- start:553 stop:981 length:429 start_codon:yes stop_codon:yes gene_type:complete
MANELVTPQMKEMFEDLIGTYGWFILAGFLAVLLKDAIHKAAEGFMVFMGKDFQNDDILYISGRQARIVRVGFFKTIFYMTDRKTKMVVPNDRLKMLVVEKTLPKNGGFPYLFKAGEAGYEEQNEILKQMNEIPKTSKKDKV